MKIMKVLIHHPTPIIAHSLTDTISRLQLNAEIIQIPKLDNLRKFKGQEEYFLIVFIDSILSKNDLNLITEIKISTNTSNLIILSDHERNFILNFLKLGINDNIIDCKTDWNSFADKIQSIISKGIKPDPNSTTESEFCIKLTKRQKQLLLLSCQGKSNREISEILNLSEHTVKVHAWRLYKKMGVTSRMKAIFKARELGLI